MWSITGSAASSPEFFLGSCDLFAVFDFGEIIDYKNNGQTQEYGQPWPHY